MRQRLTLGLSASAFALALLGSTPLGEAAGNGAKALVSAAKPTATKPGPRGPRGFRGPRGLRGPQGLASITDASAAKRYLLKVEPGNYDIVRTRLVLKPFVDLEGSGAQATRILTQHDVVEGSIAAAADSQLRDLGVSAVFGRNGFASEVIAAVGTPRFVLDGVEVVANGLFSAGIIGVYVEGGPVTVKSSTVRLTGVCDIPCLREAVRTSNAQVTFEGTTLSAETQSSNSTALHAFTSNVSFAWGTISVAGGGTGLRGFGSTTFVGVHSSRLLGGSLAESSAVLKCAGTYDEDLNLVGSTCL